MAATHEFPANTGDMFLSEKRMLSENAYFQKRIQSITRTADEMGVDIRFVGGVIGDLFSQETEIRVESADKKIFLFNHNPIKVRRGDGTVKDLDMISFCADKSRVETLKSRLKQEEFQDRLSGLPSPQISLEPTFYENAEGEKNPWPKRRRWRQAVSTIDHDETGYSLNYGSIHVPVSDRSLEKWTIVLEDGTEFPTFHPYGHVLRYFMRFPSGLKPKDKIKVSRMFQIGLRVIEHGASENDGKDPYATDYDPWFHFIDRMLTDMTPNLVAKDAVLRLYWNTIGTAAAHGRGIFRLLAPLADKGTG